MFRPNPDGGLIRVHSFGTDDATYRRDRKSVEKAVAKQRRKMTDTFAKSVANVVNKAPPGGRIAAIEAAFGVSERTAKRYKKEAEKRGLIDDE